jgi:hypothetical protein
LDAEVTEEYWNAITVIEAQEMLKQMTVSAYPHIKPEKARSIHRGIHKQAYPKTHEGPAVGPQDLTRILGAERMRKNG